MKLSLGCPLHYYSINVDVNMTATQFTRSTNHRVVLLKKLLTSGHTIRQSVGMKI